MNADWGAGRAERAGGVKDVAGAKDAVGVVGGRVIRAIP